MVTRQKYIGRTSPYKMRNGKLEHFVVFRTYCMYGNGRSKALRNSAERAVYGNPKRRILTGVCANMFSIFNIGLVLISSVDTFGLPSVATLLRM